MKQIGQTHKSRGASAFLLFYFILCLNTNYYLSFFRDMKYYYKKRYILIQTKINTAVKYH